MLGDEGTWRQSRGQSLLARTVGPGPRQKCRQMRAWSSLSASRVIRFFGQNLATAASFVPTAASNAPLSSFDKLELERHDLKKIKLCQEPFRGAASSSTYRIILHPYRISFDAFHRVDDGDRLNMEAFEFREFFPSPVPTVSHRAVHGSSGTGLALTLRAAGLTTLQRIHFHGSLDSCSSELDHRRHRVCDEVSISIRAWSCDIAGRSLVHRVREKEKCATPWYLVRPGYRCCTRTLNSNRNHFAARGGRLRDRKQ